MSRDKDLSQVTDRWNSLLLPLDTQPFFSKLRVLGQHALLRLY